MNPDDLLLFIIAEYIIFDGVKNWSLIVNN